MQSDAPTSNALMDGAVNFRLSDMRGKQYLGTGKFTGERSNLNVTAQLRDPPPTTGAPPGIVEAFALQSPLPKDMYPSAKAPGAVTDTSRDFEIDWRAAAQWLNTVNCNGRAMPFSEAPEATADTKKPAAGSNLPPFRRQERHAPASSKDAAPATDIKNGICISVT